ncbi:MAG: S1-like domain-containing RNA-binding protein [Bacteroidales bacterium]|nr:S1-like domain-containing RNA-binding protein [Bacteroidales bacterium]HPY82486.1 S1-like domain-containing RNA-binding protein [Bacteroidales bacterium]
MIEIGITQQLTVVKIVDFGAYLDGGPYGEILLPKRYIVTELAEGDEIEVFIYFDSEDRIIATTEKPYVMVGECAFLNVVQVNRHGAFLDWGLSKDLFVPFREQMVKMQEGKSYCVRVYVDEKTQRIAASTKIESYFPDYFPPYKVDQEVDILVHSKTDLGFKVIVEDSFWGLIYQNEIFEPIAPGDAKTAFIKKVREDGKIDLTLQKIGFSKMTDMQSFVLQKLIGNDGFLPYNDKSTPEQIQQEFAMSKKNFKMTIGMLYKQRKIAILKNGIRLIEK